MESTSGVSHQSAVRIRWRLWLKWVLANGVGFGIGFSLFITILVQNEGSVNFPVSILVGILVWSLIGLSVGTAQWMALRPVLSNVQWIFATVAGWAVGVGISAVLSFVSMPAMLPYLGMPGSALAYGTGAGMLQALVLRCPLRRAVVWVLVSIAGWAAGWAFWIPLHPFFTMVQQVAGAFASVFAVGAIVGGASGMLTGLALLWLLRPSEHLA